LANPGFVKPDFASWIGKNAITICGFARTDLGVEARLKRFQAQ
jgi:hypothetical protein